MPDDLTNDDQAALALARRMMLDVRQLLEARGGEAVAILLVMRRLKITDRALVDQALSAGISRGLLIGVDDTHVGLGEEAKALFARRRLMLKTYLVERPKKAPGRQDRRRRRQGPGLGLRSFGDRKAALKAWRDANEPG